MQFDFILSTKKLDWIHWFAKRWVSLNSRARRTCTDKTTRCPHGVKRIWRIIFKTYCATDWSEVSLQSLQASFINQVLDNEIQEQPLILTQTSSLCSVHLRILKRGEHNPLIPYIPPAIRVSTSRTTSTADKLELGMQAAIQKRSSVKQNNNIFAVYL